MREEARERNGTGAFRSGRGRGDPHGVRIWGWVDKATCFVTMALVKRAWSSDGIRSFPAGNTRGSAISAARLGDMASPGSTKFSPDPYRRFVFACVCSGNAVNGLAWLKNRFSLFSEQPYRPACVFRTFCTQIQAPFHAQEFGSAQRRQTLSVRPPASEFGMGLSGREHRAGIPLPPNADRESVSPAGDRPRAPGGSRRKTYTKCEFCPDYRFMAVSVASASADVSIRKGQNFLYYTTAGEKCPRTWNKVHMAVPCLFRRSRLE